MLWVNILGSVGHAVSVMTPQLCLRQVTAATHNTSINEHGSVLVKSHLQKQEACQIWPTSHGLPTAPRLKTGKFSKAVWNELGQERVESAAALWPR